MHDSSRSAPAGEAVDHEAAAAGADPALASRVVQSAAWILALRITGRLATLLRTVILVRLLTPHDFGLVGVALAVISFVEAFSGTGMHLVLLNRARSDRQVLDVAWTISVVRGAALAALLMLLAPWLAAFFAAPDAVNIIRFMALAPLLEGASNIGVIEYRRDLTFGPFYLLHAAGEIADLLVAVPLALWLGNAWALVGAWIALWSMRLVASYLLHPYRPRLRLDWTQSHTLLRHAGHVTGSTSIMWLLAGGIDAGVGKVLGVEALGLYRLAKLIAALVPLEIANVLAWVSVAWFARLATARDRLQRAFLDLFACVQFAAAPLCLGTLLWAPALVHLVLGERWAALVPLIRVMSLYGFVRSINAVAGALFQGQGVPRYQTHGAATELVLALVLFLPSMHAFGLIGAAFASASAAAGGTILTLLNVRRTAGVSLRDVAVRASWPWFATAPIVAAWLLLGTRVDSLASFATVVLVSGSAYLVVLLILSRRGVLGVDLIGHVQRHLRPWRPVP